MAPPHKIDASNVASTSVSFFSCLLFFSDCYCCGLCDEWVFPFSSALSTAKIFFVNLNWKKIFTATRFKPSTFLSNTWQILHTGQQCPSQKSWLVWVTLLVRAIYLQFFWSGGYLSMTSQKPDCQKIRFPSPLKKVCYVSCVAWLCRFFSERYS